MQVVNALVKADRDFDMLIIPGAGHGAAGSAYGRRRQKDYFVRNLLGVEPRWEPLRSGRSSSDMRKSGRGMAIDT